MRRFFAVLFLYTSVLFSQNYAGYPQTTFTASASGATKVSGGIAITRGTAVTLTGTSTCPSGTCQYIIDNGVGAVAPTFSATVNPAQTKTYMLTVVNSGVVVVARTVTVFVGNNGLSAIQSMAPSAGGPGVPSSAPQYGVIEVTIDIPGAGCSLYVPTGQITHRCGGGTVNNPWDIVAGWATFTGETTHNSYTVGLFYTGGANTGDGNSWKFRFSPQSVETWDYSATVSDPSDYKTFSQTAMFTSVPDPLNPGPLSVYSGANKHLLQTRDGNVFYPLGVNWRASDIGNLSAAGGPCVYDYGWDAAPMTGSTNDRVNSAGCLGQLASVGFNLISIAEDQAVQAFSTSALPGGNLYRTGGVGQNNGNTDNPATAIPMDAMARYVLALRAKVMLTPETKPDDTVFFNSTTPNPFTSVTTTQNFLRAWQYYINRWAAYTDVFNIGNEIAANDAFDETACLWIKQQDPYGKVLCTVSNGSSGVPIRSPNLDLNTPHYYFPAAICPTGPNSGATPATCFTTTEDTEVAQQISLDQNAVPDVPLIFGETGTTGSSDADPLANEVFRIQAYVGLLNNAFMQWYPSIFGDGQPGSMNAYLGAPTQMNLALYTGFASSLDPASATLTVAVNGGTNGQKLRAYALASPKQVSIYIVNGTNRSTVHNSTVQFAAPAANMQCTWFEPANGSALGRFTTSSSAGTQTFTIPDWGNGQTLGDLALRCVSPLNPVVTSVMVPPALDGTPYTSSLAAVGGSGPPYIFSVVAGAMPHGLTLDASTGAITGTPDMALNWTVLVQARDSGGVKSAVQKLIIPVLPALSVPPLPFYDNGVVGTPISHVHNQANVVGGMPPVSCSTSGLPGGVSGATDLPYFTGTPTSSGTFNVTTACTDALGKTASGSSTLDIIPTPAAMVTASMPPATSGYAYNAALQSAGGGTSAFTISSGALCNGLSIPGPGIYAGITGIVSSPGGTTCNFSLIVSNNAGASAPSNYAIAVNPPPSITTPSLNQMTAGSGNWQTLSSSGGTGPVWWSVSQGVLPSGVYLDALGGELYGTPGEIGNFPIVLTVTDAWGANASQAYNLKVSAFARRPAVRPR